MKHVMLDIETLDNTMTSVIASIGAVTWDENRTDPIIDKFYVNLTYKDQVALGLTIGDNPNDLDATMNFWAKQAGKTPVPPCVVEAFKELPEETLKRWGVSPNLTWRVDNTVPQISLEDGLSKFLEWFPRDAKDVWAQGTDFDMPILRNACNALKIGTLPWKFWLNRDSRTVQSLMPRNAWVKDMNAHNALDDSIMQAKNVTKFLLNYSYK